MHRLVPPQAHEPALSAHHAQAQLSSARAELAELRDKFEDLRCARFLGSILLVGCASDGMFRGPACCCRKLAA